MKESIKKRIEAVRHGEVPEGYRIENGYLIPNDWKTVPLNSRFTRSTRKNKEGCENVLTISAQMGLVNQREFYDKDIASEDKSGYFLMKNGEFAYNKSYSTGYPYGAIKQLAKYDEGIVSPLYICFAPKAGTNTAFYTQYFEGGRYNREIYRIAQEGARNHGLLNIAVDDFFTGTLTEPGADEQQRIAEILATCDRVIELTQGKMDELNKLKQTCLRKMFPQKGQAVPEARFPGYSDLWDQRKISELAVFEKGSGYSKEDLKEVGTPIILYGRLYTKYQFEIGEVDTFADIKTGSVFSKGDEVIVPASGETAEDIARAAAIVKPGILLGGDLNILHPFAFMNPSFVALSISNGQPQKELAKKAQGKSVVHVHNSDIQEVTICYPGRDEQDKIVSFFSRLDGLITLHQRELEEYEKYKKALMQLLLTGLVRVNA